LIEPASQNFTDQVKHRKPQSKGFHFFKIALASVLIVNSFACSSEGVETKQQLSKQKETRSIEQSNYMELLPTGQTNQLGNPIYALHLFVNGRSIQSFPTVTGRAFTQKLNRHQSGNESPLPKGRYTVAQYTVPGTTPEIGGKFLPIEPQFETGRFALGIHYDPSFNLSNGEDGTAGCIALTSESDLQKVLNYVQKHKPTHLDVNIM
jgi:hypothetical protein